MQSMTSPLEMWIKFVVLNLLWCTMPLVTSPGVFADWHVKISR